MGNFRYFKDEEVAGLDIELVAGLDRARHRSGVHFIITCGVRTADRNTEVGGVQDSEHLTGNAVDLRCVSSEHCFKIVEALLHEGFKRVVIGIKKNAVPGSDEFFHNVHVGNSADKPSPVLAIKLY